jgi:hypothetical protein
VRTFDDHFCDTKGISHSGHPDAERSRSYSGICAPNQIGIERLDFVLEPSETYLPRCTLLGLDVVLIDGKHAVPWSFIGWFYTAEKLKVGGLCIIDDIHLESVLTLVRFLREDPRWEFVWELPRRTIAFRKLSAYDSRDCLASATLYFEALWTQGANPERAWN